MGILGGRAAQQAQHRALGRGVMGVVTGPGQGALGSDADKGALASRCHGRQRSAHQVEHPADMHAHHALPAARGDLGKPFFLVVAGIGHHRGDRPHLRLHRSHSRTDHRRIADIGDKAARNPLGGAKIEGDHLPAMRRQLAGDARPNAAGGPAYHCYWIHHLRPRQNSAKTFKQKNTARKNVLSNAVNDGFQREAGLTRGRRLDPSTQGRHEAQTGGETRQPRRRRSRQSTNGAKHLIT